MIILYIPLAVTTTFVYDGDGSRIIKEINYGQTMVTTTYVNQYYEVTDSEVTTSYYLGSKLIAVKKGENLSYVHPDHLGSTSVTSNNAGASVSTISYFPFGLTRSSSDTLPTDRLFTGQRLDDNTGLYYYGARYYDPEIGRFISPDTIVPNPANPQSLNRYSYCLNNPLKYIDPSGHYGEEWDIGKPDNWDEWYDDYKNGDNRSYTEWYNSQNGSGVNQNSLHSGADFLGLMPIVGIVFDVSNGIRYWDDGNRVDAIWSFVGIAPGLGDLGQFIRFIKIQLRTVNRVNDLVDTTGELRVIGRYPKYMTKADELNAKRFNIPSNIYAKMTDTERWAANQKFLDRGIQNNAVFSLATDLSSKMPLNCTFIREVDYLMDRGYRLTKDGTKLVKIK